MAATLAEIGKALDVLNAEQTQAEASTFALGRNIDGSWFLSRDGDASVFLGRAKAEVLRALEAFTDGVRIGRAPVLVEAAAP